MRGISIKALIVGNVLNPALLFAATLALVMGAAAVPRTPGEDFVAAMRALSHDQGFLLAVGLAAVLIVIVVGYVAASLAAHALLLNAALSAAGLILWNFILLFRPSTQPDNGLVTVLAWTAPLFAVLGGHIRARQVAQGAGPVRWGVGVRFAVAIVIALLVGLIAFVLLARVAPFVTIPTAIVASLVAAYAIAPSEKRTLAAWTMLCIAALVAVGIFLEAAITGTLKFVDYFLLLSVAVAAFTGRGVLRPARTAGISSPVRSGPAKPDNIVIQAAPRTDLASQHLWKRPEQQRDATEENR